MLAQSPPPQLLQLPASCNLVQGKLQVAIFKLQVASNATHIPYYYCCLILAFSLYSFWLYDNTRRNLKPMWVILVTENTLSKIKHCPFLVNTVLPVRHRGCFNKVLTDFLSFLHGLHHIHFLKIKFS